MGRIVAIDYGEKRTGIAIADPLGMFAQPMGAYSPSEAIQQLRKLDADEGIGVAVVGWPLMQDGTEGESTARVGRFIEELIAVIPSAEIVRWDERYTSTEARDRIAAGPDPDAAGHTE